MKGFIRLVNKRKDAKIAPDVTELVIDVDRQNKILGNTFMMESESDRNRVCDKYEEKIAADFEQRGPMLLECGRIANLVMDGEHVALACWCVPRRCHGESVLKRVLEMAR